MVEDRAYAAYKKFLKNRMWGKALDVLEAAYVSDTVGVYPYIKQYRQAMTAMAQNGYLPAMPMLRRAYKLTARECFDDFLIFNEWDRPLKNRFYQPRRKQLLPIVNALQALADDKLDLLCVSCPPGIGKSALETFFLSWVIGKDPSLGNVVGSHNASFVRGIYDEFLRIFDPDGEYNWCELFDVRVVRTNALDMKIDVGRAQRFSSFQGCSIGGGNAGKLRAIGYLVCDDLIEGIEEALSRERLDKKFNLYSTDLRQRKQGGCKELHIATRWSLADVIGRLKIEYSHSERAAFISIPALDENDESNFDYGGSIGFTTQFYHDMRDLMDEASWRALYMNEPIERTGVLFNSDELRRFFELPTDEPEAVWAVCDTKDRGDDYYVMPVAYQYGQDFYIEKIICDNKTPEAVLPRLVDTLMSHNVKMARFESNAAGGQIATKVQDMIKDRGGITKITTKYSTAGKDTRILVDSAFIKEHFLFKNADNYDYDYKLAMNFLTSYSMVGKNKHDDVPDALSMLADFLQGFRTTTAVVMKRPF